MFRYINGSHVITADPNAGGTSILSPNVISDTEPTGSPGAVILQTTDINTQIIGANGPSMTFVASSDGDLLQSKGSDQASYTVNFNNNPAFKQFDSLDATIAGAFNGATINVLGIAAGDHFTVYGFDGGTATAITPATVHFAGVNGSAFNVNFLGFPGVLATDVATANATHTPAVWDMTIL